jgi:hypothetical protein
MKINITDLSITPFSIMQFLHSLYKTEQHCYKNWKKYSFVEKILIFGICESKEKLEMGV